jgi:glutamine synthetase
MSPAPFKGESSLDQWLDRHHVKRIRTFVTNLDGIGLGKYCNREKFLGSLPNGHNIADVALAADATSTPHFTFWHTFRHNVMGDIVLKPDLDTFVSDIKDNDLGHVICDFANLDGSAINLCPRTKLKQVVQAVSDNGFQVKATCELEFFLFENSFDDARIKQYQNLQPLASSPLETIYFLRDSYRAADFMNEVIKRLEWYGIQWEAWNDENGHGQIELNLVPTDPVTLADSAIRSKQIIFETATDMGMSATFMAHPQRGFSNGMHIHHSLLSASTPVFFDSNKPDNRSDLLLHWIAGLIDTMPAAVSYLCPTINSFRRFREFSAPPMTATWGEENKSTGIRLISKSPSTTRIEHRVGAGDLNPYLAIAAILAGGLSGLTRKIAPPPECAALGWGLPEDIPRLPRSIMEAARALAQDQALKTILGSEDVDYWIKSRRHDWLNFHSSGNDPDDSKPSQWEYERYFNIL